MKNNKFLILNSALSALISIGSVVELRRQMANIQKFNEEVKSSSFSPENEELPFVSVLVPARNEEIDIEKCLVSILEQPYPAFEVIAIDDGSTDNTPKILDRLVAKYGTKLKIVHPQEPAPGWLGKTNALWYGVKAVSPHASKFLFVDADVTLRPATLGSIVKYATAHKLDLFSLVPNSDTHKDFWHQLLRTEILKFYTLVDLHLKPVKPESVEAANALGAFIMVERSSYEAVGGHATISNYMREDVAIARTFRQGGFKTQLGIGFDLADLKTTEGFSDLWESVGKLMFLVARRNWLRILFAISFEVLYALVPLLVFIFGRKKLAAITKFANFVSVFLLLIYNIEISRAFKINFWLIPLYPLTVVLTSIVAIYSGLRIRFFSKASWKGRVVVKTDG